MRACACCGEAVEERILWAIQPDGSSRRRAELVHVDADGSELLRAHDPCSPRPRRLRLGRRAS